MQTSSTTSPKPHFRTEGFRTEARPGDAAAIEALTRATGVFSEEEVVVARELLEENLARGEEASGYSFLFDDGVGGLDGYACYGPIPMTAGRYELYWIAVHPDAGRSGLGKRLARASEDAVRAVGGTHLFATTSTRAEYGAAHLFYQAQGYRQMADVTDYFSDGDGMAMFGKKL
jgi:ribosomal protein S18 acetylase RimI-like enzyme